jgi:hypothetical protein
METSQPGYWHVGEDRVNFRLQDDLSLETSKLYWQLDMQGL